MKIKLLVQFSMIWSCSQKLACNQIYVVVISFLLAFQYFRFLGFRRSVLLDRQKLVGFIDLYNNKTISWNNFASSVQETHRNRVVQPSCRQKLENKPKEEDYFYANPHECLANSRFCSRTKDAISVRWASSQVVTSPSQVIMATCSGLKPAAQQAESILIV